MDNRVAAELLKTRNALKQKYKSLKSDVIRSQSLLEKTYKPITQPLNELVSTFIKAENSPLKTNLKNEIKEEISRESLNPRFESSRMPPEYWRTVAPIDLGEETFQYDANKVRPEFGESFFDETFTTRIADMTAEQDLYLQQFAKPLPRAYIEDKIHDVKGDFDDTFGVYFNPFTKNYAIGDSTIDFDESDFIISGQFRYKGTPGLYELMFKKHPAGYRTADLDMYIDIITRTNTHYLGYNPEKGLSTSNAPKFIDIIKPRVTSFYSMAQEKKKKMNASKQSISGRQRANSLPSPESNKSWIPMKTRSQTKKGGDLTMMEFNKKKIEYKHFDDYNEIIDRLRLLIASQLAGNTGHNNEIISIVEELKEGKIIR